MPHPTFLELLLKLFVYQSCVFFVNLAMVSEVQLLTFGTAGKKRVPHLLKGKGPYFKVRLKQPLHDFYFVVG